MNITIENKPVAAARLHDESSFNAFLLALRSLEVGQSFVVSGFDSYRRNSIKVAGVILDRQFRTKKEKAAGLTRVGRVV